MAEFTGEQLSGLAGEIRSSSTSDQYDLGGYTEQRAKDLMHATFRFEFQRLMIEIIIGTSKLCFVAFMVTSFFLSSPLTAPTEMIKCTFVVGGGKLVRSRYAEDLTKWLVAALREIGYTEDRSAAETYVFVVAS